MKYLFKGGQALINEGLIPADIMVEGESITAIGQGLEADGAQVIDCQGLIVAPGLVDIHVHLRQPGFEYKETIASGSAAAAAGGFTTVCAMPNLNPVPDSLENLAPQLEAIRQDAIVNVLPFGAITVGEKGQTLSDIDGLAPLVCGFSDDGKGVQSDAMMACAMERVKAAGSFISAHCEDESLLEGGSVHKGEYAQTHGMKGISSASEYAQIERDIQLALKTGVRYHICHISAKESVELVRQGKAKGAKVTCEVTPHHIALCDKDIDADDGKYKMNPPLRGATDRRALIAGLLDGTIDCIATDHAPHSAEEKGKGLEGSAFGIVGSETAYAVCNTALVQSDLISQERLLALLTTAPMKILGRDYGIKTGARADIVLLDPAREEAVDPAKFKSMGKNTPFAGKKLTGAVIMTVCGGKVVYRRDA